MDKLKEVKKIIQMMNEGSVTTQDLQTFITATLEFVKKQKDDFLQISQDSIDEIDKIVLYIEKEHEKTLQKVDEKSSKLEQELTKQIKEVKYLLEGAKNLIPQDGRDGLNGKDGKDGSPDTPEEIVKKINTTENSIDAKVIKDSATYVRKNDLDYAVSVLENQTRFLIASNSNRGSSTGGGGGGGVTSLNTLTGALNLVEGAGIDITTAGSDITIAAIGANVSSDTSLAVKVATTAALPGTPTYNNGTAGVGATLTRSSNGTTGTIDGVTAANLMVGDYILVKNQAAQLQNGVYSVTQQGSASLPYILTRIAEADTTAELDDLVVTAASGTTNKGVPYGQQTNNPVIGTNNIVFTATGIYMRQQTSGTQAVNQIPVYTGTALTQTKGTANFKYNPTNDLFTIRGVDYTFPVNNGDASQVLTTDGSGTLSWTTPSGGSPAGSNNQIQINQSGSFFADSTFQKSDTGFNVGLDHTTQSAVSFTGSGLDDLTQTGTFSGTYPTTYTVTIDGINKDYVNFPTSSISGSGFQVGETITSTSGGSATIDAVNVNSNNSYENLILSSITGTFLQFDTITGGTSGTTAVLDGDLSQQDTYTWTDGTTTVSNVICKTFGSTLISNNVLVNFDTGTGHTLTDSWTWTYSYVNQNVLDFSNTTFGVRSFLSSGQHGISQSAGVVSVGNLSGGNNTKIQVRDNDQLVNVLSQNVNLGNSGNTNISVSGGSNEVSVSAVGGTFTAGDVGGAGNGTKITIDDTTQRITMTNVPTYADDAAAITGGLTTGQLYKTTTGGITALNIVP